MSKYIDLWNDFLEETYGDVRPPAHHDDWVDGAMQFAEWLDNQSSAPTSNLEK